ncbi:hypothetical protein [Nocardia sp. NPDC004750]
MVGERKVFLSPMMDLFDRSVITYAWGMSENLPEDDDSYDRPASSIRAPSARASLSSVSWHGAQANSTDDDSPSGIGSKSTTAWPQSGAQLPGDFFERTETPRTGRAIRIVMSR